MSSEEAIAREKVPADGDGPDPSFDPALGRRGTPRKLGVPGEELPKVVYRLIDPEQYRGKRVLVVGTGGVGCAIAASLAGADIAAISLFDVNTASCEALAKRLKDNCPQIDVRIGTYIAGVLKTTPEKARVVQKQYWKDHGTSMRGMMTLHGVDPKHYLDYVHDIDYSPVEANPALDRALAALPGRKIIFTAGDVHTKPAANPGPAASASTEVAAKATLASLVPSALMRPRAGSQT